MNILLKENWVVRKWSDGLWIILLAVLYTASGLAGLYFSPEGVSVTYIWPPLGIAVAFLYLRGMQIWPAILLGEIGLELLLGYSFGEYYNVLASNLLSSITVALILRNSDFDPAMGRLKDLLILLLRAGMAAILINACLGAIPSIYLGKYDMDFISGLPSLFLWVAGDYLSLILYTPLILQWTQIRAGEWLALISLFLVVLGFVFFVDHGFSHTGFPASFLIFPLLIWAGMRFGVQGVLLANFFVTCIALIGVTQNLNDLDLENYPVLFSIFLLTSQISALFLAVINEARRTAENRVQRGRFFSARFWTFYRAGC